MVIVLMGVAGAGKTTIGQLLAAQLHWLFADADDYHSPANIAKMRAGIPLTDEEREPWLETLRMLITGWIVSGQNAVLACSALKHSYRERLRVVTETQFVYLKVSPEILRERLRARHGHYMTEKMLASQLATLEEPQQAIVVDGDGTPDEIISEILVSLKLAKVSS